LPAMPQVWPPPPTTAEARQQPAPHFSIPVWQVKPQLVPSQVAVAFAGGMHRVQLLVPQLATALLETHWPEQAWYPELQTNPHAPETQVGNPFAGAVHGVHEAPQALALPFEVHCPEQ